MKKLLLSITLVLTSLILNAQNLLTENFDSLNVGNISTEITGAVAGQGGYYLLSENGAAPTTTTNAGVTLAQILAGGNASKGIQMVGPNGDSGGSFVWKDGLPALWTARTAGNQIIELELDINPGSGTTTSKNTFGAYIYNSNFTRVLVGFVVAPATRELLLVAYSTPSGQAVGNYTYTLAASPGIQLPANSFSRIGISYNFTTGQVRIKAPGLAAAGLPLTGSSPSTAPAEVDFVALSGGTTTAPNLSSTTAVMDNLTLRASSTDTLLGNASFENATVSFSVSPNPANDFISVTNTDNIVVSGISITDLNGRVVKQNSYSNVSDIQVNVADLASGIYMMNITSDKGSVTKKIVKN